MILISASASFWICIIHCFNMQEYIYSPKKIFYKKNEFKPGRPALVFVHGLSDSSSAWLPYEKKFEAQSNILTFDLRGHGYS